MTVWPQQILRSERPAGLVQAMNPAEPTRNITRSQGLHIGSAKATTVVQRDQAS